MRHAHFVIGIALVAAIAVLGCRDPQQASNNGTGSTGSTPNDHVAQLMLPSGTSIDVTLATRLTSETARVGDAWSGTIRNGSFVDGQNIVPAGSTVSGSVTAVTQARKGDRAMLDLRMNTVTVGDHSYQVLGTMQSVVAGSTRARNLGAIGAATVAGAVVGHQVGGSDKGTVVGGLIGAGAATGVVSQTKGWQVVLKEGTPLTFTTSQAVAVRL